MNELVRAVHDALNATAVPRRPEASLLPPTVAGVSVALPEPTPVPGTLADAVDSRRSRYAFGPGQPSLADLASVLLRGVLAAPRAGGLPSVVPFLVVRGEGEVTPGVHRVELHDGCPRLVGVRHGDPTSYLAAALDQPPFATRVPVWVALGLDVGATRHRYPPRHYRTLHLDAGIALQNALLVATALGLSTCPVMGYDDEAVGALLDLDHDVLVAGLVALGPARVG